MRAMLIDTSVWIEHLRGRPGAASEQLAEWLRDDPDRILVNEVVTCELLRGLRDDASALRLQVLLADCLQALPIERSDWIESAALYRRCRQVGATIRSALDCLMAAHAIRLQVPILAIDRDYTPIAQHFGLRLWQPTS